MQTVRRSLFSKLSTRLFQQLESATALASERGDPEVSLGHWLLQIWHLESADLRLICAHFELDDTEVLQGFSASLGRRGLRLDRKGLDFSPDIELAIERAWLLASVQANDHKIRSAWLLMALLQTPALCKALYAISSEFQRLPKSGLFAQVQHLLSDSLESEDSAQSGGGKPASPEASGGPAAAPGSDSALSTYCTDLTQWAREGKIDPVVGRDREIRVLMDVLLRRKQNNPLLVGEAGVGKTAVVEGLAHAIARAQVPTPLKGVRLLSLDIGGLLAGAAMRGEFEARLRSVLDESTQSSQPTILFVDEVHTLVGAGGSAGTGDAANLLKPALARGQLRLIGATTWSEYKRHIEKDPALTRRFQAQLIEEPDDARAFMMVRSLVGPFQRHHGVHIRDEAVASAVTLSRRYLPARQLPDKAISLLDTACARVALTQHVPPALLQAKQQALADLERQRNAAQQDAQLRPGPHPQVQQLQQQLEAAQAELSTLNQRWEALQALLQAWGAARDALQTHPDPAADAPVAQEQAQQDMARLSADIERSPLWSAQQSLVVDHEAVAAVVSEWTGVPAGQMLKDDVRAMAQLQARLETRVLGQSWALRTIADRIKAARAQLTDPGKPLGVFMLVGPSGVGKTETALALAEAVYGGAQNLITINMSEYQEAHTVSSLKGSPPGYVGFGEGGVLTEAVRRRPYSVVLLDEVEKAHPDVHEIFYQVFDKGWMDDGEGRTIDFTNTLILLTSNVGAELIQECCADEAVKPGAAQLVSLLDAPLRAVFPAAFLGRVSVVPYLPLDPSRLSAIARLQLAKVEARMRTAHGLGFNASDAAVQSLIAQCGINDTGARRISQFIEQHILPAIAQRWLDAQEHGASLTTLSLEWMPETQVDAIDPAGHLVLRSDATPHPASGQLQFPGPFSTLTDQETP
ncbi:MAG: type VI secretion system ATPase TssH [Ideonella sp. MAG2]|nr:MAG: type VI secretion system ATPase TssH [Ideonella sp. MAG2]